MTIDIDCRGGQTARASSILGPKTASFYSSGSARVSLLVEYSARNTRLFGRPSSTRLGILDFLADLRVLGSEYSTFRPNFRVQSLGNRLSKSLEICCASCPDYGPLWIKISSNSDKQFPSDCSRKLGRKNRQFTIPCEIN